MFYESETFFLLDWINRLVQLAMYRAGTHQISLLEIIDKTGETIEFRDFSETRYFVRNACMAISRNIWLQKWLGIK
jgi:hypothetical protein